MNLPEYYLTRCEFEIFQKHRDAIFRKLDNAPFDLIELGAGDGLKTQVLLQHFLNQNADFRYLPIDISGSVLGHLQQTLRSDGLNCPSPRLKASIFRRFRKLTDSLTGGNWCCFSAPTSAT